MTTAQRITFYNDRKLRFSKDLDSVNSQINMLSNARLLVAALFFILLYFGFKTPPLLYVLFPLAAGFIALMRYHSKGFEQKTHFEHLIDLNDREIKLLRGQSNAFDSGAEFLNAHHPYSYDLDIFGEGSLYQSLTRVNTIIGKKKLSERLAHSLATPETIISNQQAIAELISQVDFRQDFFAAGREISEQPEDREQLRRWLSVPTIVYGSSFFRIVLVALPVITLALFVGLYFSHTFRPFIILMAVVQWSILAFKIKQVNAFHDYIGRRKNVLQKYAALLQRLNRDDFQSPMMKSITTSARDAGRRVRKLSDLVFAFDARANSLVSLFVNSFVLYDLQYVYRLERWREENAQNLEQWLEAAAETEVLCSFSTFAFNHPQFTFPSINSNMVLRGEQVGHPLIEPEYSVPNSFEMDAHRNVVIVTGANMAGKSTFLRTIGINLVLALNGSPVCAAEFTCPIIKLRTGMRTADSLKDHQSYFYAELDRLKGIMDELRQNVPLLILLDEILKGTNSTDKQAGSIALVKQLLPHPCLAVIATHDLALGDLEKDFPGQVRNFHFEPNIENDQLSFDYKLKPGIAEKMNATFLMKKMGIIPA